MAQLAPANNLLNHLQKHLNVKNDAQLGKLIDISPPQMSKMRSAVLVVGPSTILKIHEATDISIKELKELAGLPPARPYVPNLRDQKDGKYGRNPVPNE